MTTGMAKIMIEIPEKYALEVSSPAPIRSERQHEEYLWVLDKLISKAPEVAYPHFTPGRLSVLFSVSYPRNPERVNHYLPSLQQPHLTLLQFLVALKPVSPLLATL
jgi:hypothetical protein